jgi:ketosteroid isomerase-like protein
MDAEPNAGSPIATLRRLEAATNAHDLEALVDCFAVDYANETPVHPARGFTGREQVRRNWQSIFAGVPDVRAQVLRTAVDGGTVWSEWEMSGTRRDGVPHQMRGVVIFHFLDGRAAWARFYLEPVDHAGSDVDSAISTVVGVAS